MSATLQQIGRTLAQERLLETVYQTYHYDFRHYAWSSLQRCIARAQAALGSASIEHLIRDILAEEAVFTRFLRHMTIQTSDLFRDPGYFLALRQAVLPHLATYPFIRIWVAGCGSGEEAYSLAILLHETGLLERSQIYATDIDPESLRLARLGVYDARRLPGFTANYLDAGGKASLSEYYTGTSSTVTFAGFLARRIVFSDHSLATDGTFAEVQLVSCRNVLIYFERPLQERAIDLFLQSLCPRGFLGLGSKETLAFASHAASFEPFNAEQRIYRVKP
jgi:chemotaxis protein methyltransferase CheR